MHKISVFMNEGLPPAWNLALRKLKRMVAPSRRYRHCRALHKKMGSPTTIQQGPFRGMVYSVGSVGSTFFAKLMGTYEQDLWPTLDAIRQLDPDLVIDVGCAEGYYAVGMALLLPRCRVLAYDTLKLARYATTAMARNNQVGDRVETRGFCSPEELNRVIAPVSRPLVICDCEGFEDQLLVPAKAPQLSKAAILVEVHDRIIPGISELLRERFATTHTISRIEETPRSEADLPAGMNLSREDTFELMDEARGYLMHWYFMTPRTGA